MHNDGQPNEGVFLGNVDSFGTQYQIYRRWDRQTKKYVFLGVCSGRSTPLYKISENDWRDNHLRGLATDTIRKLSKIDAEAGFGEEETCKKSISSARLNPSAQTENGNGSSPVPKAAPSEIDTKYVSDVDYEGRTAKFYSIIGKDSKFLLEPEGSQPIFLTRVDKPKGAEWETNNEPLPSAVSYRLEIALMKTGHIKKVCIEEPKIPKNENAKHQTKRYLDPDSPENMPYLFEILENQESKNREKPRLPRIRSPQAISACMPEEPAPRKERKHENSGAASHRPLHTEDMQQAGLIIAPYSDLNNFLIYLHAVDDMDFVQAAAKQLKSSNLIKDFEKRSKEYTRFIDSTDYDAAIKSVGSLPISEESKESVIKTLEKDRLDKKFEADPLTIVVPTQLQGKKLTVVLPISSYADALESELFGHSLGALREIGRVTRKKENDAVVMTVAKADIDSVASYIKMLMDVPETLSKAGIQIRTDVFYMPKESGKKTREYHRPKGTGYEKKSSENGASLTFQILNYASKMGKVSSRSIMEIVPDKTHGSIYTAMNILKKKGMLEHDNEKGEYVMTPTGVKYLEEHENRILKPKPKTQNRHKSSDGIPFTIKILEYAEINGKITLKSATEYLGLKSTSVSSILSQAVKKGHLIRPEEGVYEITPEGINYEKNYVSKIAERQSPAAKGESNIMKLIQYAAGVETVRAADAEAAINHPRKYISVMLPQLEKKGIFERIEKGLYKITPEGRAQA